MLLPNPPNNRVGALQKTVFGFVWNRKQEKSRKTAVKNIVKRGLGIPDIRNYADARNYFG